MNHIIICKECGYEGTTTTTAIFPTGLGNYRAARYVCPICKSRNIEYKPRENMQWAAGMSRIKELKKMHEVIKNE